MIRPGPDLLGIEPTAVPLALADLHRHLGVGDRVELVLPGASPDHARDLLVGAGFEVARLDVEDGPVPRAAVRAVRLRSLPDTVGPGMRLLVCGLNPSLHAADAGVGYSGPSNRFWPAALAAGLVTVPHDARRALVDHGVGMTDLVRRATRRADEVTRDEYVAGAARVERLVRWLRPGALCVVGLAGWRRAVDRAARPGRRAATFGGRPVYLMGSTSGLNAHATSAGLADDLRAAAALADDALRSP